jgi:glycerophosphoryl diester phosphodiesterase
VTIVIAHRGASAAYRENTVAAFVGARHLGADMVELDVRRTADGVLAVFHDAYLPDGRAVTDVTAADLPDWLPTLDQALDACDGMGVNIEVKNLPGEPGYDDSSGVAVTVAELVGARALHDRILVSSFNLRDLDRVREVDAAVRTAWLVFSVADAVETSERCARHGHGALHPHVSLVTDGLLDACRRAGLAVNTWTVDDPDVMRRLVADGVDGIVTNRPDVLVDVLGRA